MSSILDHDALLAGRDDADWYKRNIPFVDLPDETIQAVYYYRWSVFKRHLRYHGPDVGHIVSEFVCDVDWGKPHGAISCAAGHHIHEGRWLREPLYLDDYQRYWLKEPGTTLARKYSFWAASSYYARYLVNIDAAFLTECLPGLIRQYDGWADHFDGGVGLYWQVPLFDGMENNLASLQTNNRFSGGPGFRPSINAYQWADAMAISRIADIKGDAAMAADFADRAAKLKANMQRLLWDPEREFFFHRMIQNETQSYPHVEGTLLDGREAVGFTPWYFNMPDPEYSVAWKQLMDPEGFFAEYGPTTAERRHRFFMTDARAKKGCFWNGPSWPFATSQILTALANLLNNYEQAFVTRADYVALLHNYARTQFKDGKPYIAEGHDPDEPVWIYDSRGVSEDYNHSTFNDLVLTGLIGLRPREDDVLELSPLIPDSWDYFAVENLQYHGHDLSIAWDRTGRRYGRGAGLQIWQNGVPLAQQAALARMKVAFL